MSGTLELIESWVSMRTQWHFVVLRDSEITAVGECSDSGRPEMLVETLTALAPQLRGRDFVSDRTQLLRDLLSGVEAVAPGRAFVSATLLGGLEQMLTDYAAQAAGVPVWKWLGGSAKSSVPVYANINRVPGGRTPEEVAAAAVRAAGAGFRAVKCAPFDVHAPGEQLIDVGLARLRAVRDAVGDDIALKVDCHERLSAEEVHQVLPALEELGIAWLEDAVAIDEAERLRELRRATELPLAGGETMFAVSEAEAAIAEGLVNVLMPDVKHAGGISRVLDIARSAPGLEISPHNPSGPIATAASAHLFAACSNASVLEFQFSEAQWRSALVGGNERVAEGQLFLDDRPGLGVTLPSKHPSFRILWSTTV